MICVGEGSAALDPHVCLTTCLHNSTAPRAWHTRSMCALSLCPPTRAIAVPQRAASKLRTRAHVHMVCAAQLRVLPRTALVSIERGRALAR